MSVRDPAEGPTKAPEFPPTPFISPRNLPFWAGVTFVLIVIGLIYWLG